ncbi:MAG TPA: TIGR01212 family radical SAM protein [Gammaproteobacteria bacterium]|nr:TIGR01212 family radical SAM protein [Gammaproteobacteria bacterium]
MVLSDYVNTLGQALKARYGQRVHKLAIDAGLTCPNRDGTKGRAGCTFCNNASFSPNAHSARSVSTQIQAGRGVVRKRTGARRFIAYFQTYTNTYADEAHLRSLYEAALAEPDVVGLAIGTRPDCVPASVLDLLASYKAQGWLVWLELGLQSSFDETLRRINRGHGFGEYRDAVAAAHQRDLAVCTHLIIGLPGEDPLHARTTLERVLALGVEGLKLHPLHVVKGTRLAGDLRRRAYQPITREAYVRTAADLIERTPAQVVFHRVTGTASRRVLRAPAWCAEKWSVLNAIEAELRHRRSRQGTRV